MSPRRNINMRIALPPRLLSLNSGDSPLSSPCSTAPHTPMPYEIVTTPDGIAQQYHEMHFDEVESVSSTGSKRGREDDEEEASWTEADMSAMQSILVHPFRPLSTPFPPGELPPPDVLDDLTHQLLKYAYRPSPSSKRNSRKPLASLGNEDGWTHTWEATRRKLFRLALAESQEAHGQSPAGRKLPRNERIQRPGLKRMDSMDFLDEGEDNSTEKDQIGRALRLSTTLQNSSKLGALTRSTSDDVNTTSSSSRLQSPPNLEAPAVPAAITITPSSPVAAPPLRRRGSSRTSQPRSSRPSLLQRGRSFTASDLEADSGILASPTAAGRADAPPDRTDRSQSPTPISSEKLSTRRAEPKLLTIPAYMPSTSRLTRSQSNEMNLNAHAAQKLFCAPRQPTTNERAMLAMPFESSPSRTKKTSNGWSDSEDEGNSTAVRHIRKTKPNRNARQGPALAMPFHPLIQGGMLGSSALRSPFEEKMEINF